MKTKAPEIHSKVCRLCGTCIAPDNYKCNPQKHGAKIVCKGYVKRQKEES